MMRSQGQSSSCSHPSQTTTAASDLAMYPKGESSLVGSSPGGPKSQPFYVPDAQALFLGEFYHASAQAGLA